MHDNFNAETLRRGDAEAKLKRALSLRKDTFIVSAWKFSY